MNELTFEQASARLDAILAELSSDQTPLDRSLTLYAEAASLISACEKMLERAQVVVEEIDARFAAGEPEEEEADDGI